MKKSKFQIECEALSEKTGIYVMFFEDKDAQKPVEDDGNLHITKRGLRACFDVGNGQSLSGKDQNENTRTILKALGMEDAINDRTLVDETDEDEENECCEHCGR